MAEQKQDMIFVEGMRFFKPRDNAPKTIKGNIVIDLAQLREFLKKNEIKDLLRVDLRKSETKGTYYFSLNTWKPTKPESTDRFAIEEKEISVSMVEGVEYPEEDINPDDIPFN